MTEPMSISSPSNEGEKKTIKPIRIFHGDDEDGVRDRHDRIVKRLEEIGPDEVKRLAANGGFSPQWEPIIGAWLKGDKLEAKKEPEKAHE
jgi:hypothetical protein